jgi:type II secretory pathway component PulF
MEINLQHINTGLLSALTLWEALKAISRMTPTKRDDEVIAKVEGAVSATAEKVKSTTLAAIEQVRRRAPYFWAIVEVAERTGLIPDKAQKPLEFLKRIRAAIPGLPPEAEAEAQKIAAELSAEAKK